jgi:Domain of unknown function (DUF4055)
MDKPTVATQSSERQAMDAAWTLIADVRNGVDAIKAKPSEYLPKFEKESAEEHKRRVKAAPWRPEFADILSGLVAKPFTKDIKFTGEAVTPEIEEFYEDVDRRGNNLTVFARSVFESAITDGWTTVLVDYPPSEGVQNRAQLKATGNRPYWVHIPAASIVAMYCDFIDGVEQITHVRISEKEVQRDGFGEITVERIRVLEPGTYELWEKNAKGEWFSIAQGVMTRGVNNSVPMVRIWTGERKGEICVKPPLLDIAHMQVELFRAGSRRDDIMTYTASPLLTILGMDAPGEALAVGPRSVICVPSGEGNIGVDYLVPPAANIKEVRDDENAIAETMRRLGMQPVVNKAGSMVATAASIETARAHSVLQAWVMLLKDGLESCFKLTAEYMGIPDNIELNVHSDFSVGLAGDMGLNTLADASKRAVISDETYRDEMRRRDILSPEITEEIEQERLAEQADNMNPDGEETIDPATGKVIPPADNQNDADAMLQQIMAGVSEALGAPANAA